MAEAIRGHRITSVPGASAYFERGVLAYSDQAKRELLGVPPVVLRASGGVSAECAETMARGVAALAGTSCGLAVEGIAGPGGGTPTRPVGTIYVSVVVKGEALTRRFQFAGERASVNWQATQAALDLLRRSLGTRS